MNFKLYFSSWAKEVDRYLASYLARRSKEASKRAPIVGDLISDFSEFLIGGKRLRAGLVKLGYEVFGGKNTRTKILPISAAAELLNGALLVHDDVVDRGDLRHNKPTIHVKYATKVTKDAVHYGESMAIAAGDVGFYETIDAILSSSFPSNIKEKVIQEVIHVGLDTMYGEVLDIDLTYKTKITEKEIMTVNRLKTALYTFVGPLNYGALAAGAEEKALTPIKEYGLPVGIAFQLQDDILGMFGDEKTLGKPVDSDIKEGKNTLLYLEALKRGNAIQRAFLKKVWGNPHITVEQVEQARKIINDTGSLAYSVEFAHRLVEEGKRAIPKITKDPEYQEIFSTLADYIIEREK